MLPAFAEVAPIYYDEITEYTDEMLDEFGIPVEEEIGTNTKQQTPVIQKPIVAKRNVAGRSVSRATPTGNTAKVASRTNVSSRAVASSPRNAQQTPRSTVSRTVKTRTAAITTKKPSVVSRSRATTRLSRSGTTSAKVTTQSTTLNTNADTDASTSARISANGNVISGVRDYYLSSSTTSPTILTDSGNPLYISNSAGNNASRRPAVRTSGVIAKTSTLTSAEAANATDNLSAVSDLTEYCKTQYAQCMDNYCNVLDENQGKCSCSSDIQSYENLEKELTQRNEEFQDAIQKIKYIGLTAEQIETLFKETEAEIALKDEKNKDTSAIKSSLDEIKDKILNSSFGTANTNSGSDLDVTFDTSGFIQANMSSASVQTFNINSFINNGSTNVTHPRGKELFETATDRCGIAVLDACVEKGIDSDIIVNSYDLAIDKDCIEYERALKEKTTEMRNNVRNAQNVLQQARLLVAQRKNAYDLRGCVEALDECMQGEYVCGEDYTLCLDPTGKYIADGKVIPGSKPGVAGVMPTSSTTTGLANVWKYSGLGSDWQMSEFITAELKDWKPKSSSTTSNKSDIAIQLLTRIGYIEEKNGKTTNYGMCSEILNQCQNYTYETVTGGKLQYYPDNEVVRQYLSLALTKIKAKQDTILAEYAENCWTDVYTCITLNNYNETLPATNAVNKAAVASCKNEINTCMSVADAGGTADNWVANHIVTDTSVQWAIISFAKEHTPTAVANAAAETANANIIKIIPLTELGNGGILDYKNNCNPTDESDNYKVGLRCSGSTTYLMRLQSGGLCPTKFMNKKVTTGAIPTSTSWVAISDAILQYNPDISGTIRCNVTNDDAP